MGPTFHHCPSAILPSSRSIVGNPPFFPPLVMIILLLRRGSSFGEMLLECGEVSDGLCGGRNPFRTYWSSAPMVNPSGSAPYPATGGGRWGAAQSNRECWLLSDACRYSNIMTTMRHEKVSKVKMGWFMMRYGNIGIRMLVTTRAAFSR